MAYSELTLAEDGGGVSASADTPPRLSYLSAITITDTECASSARSASREDISC